MSTLNKWAPGLIACLLLACAEDEPLPGDDDQGDPTALSCQIATLTEKSDGETSEDRYKYDTSGKLTSFENFVTESDGTTSLEEFRFSYTGDLITSASYYEDGVMDNSEQITIAYDGSKLTKLIDTDGEDGWIYEARLIYSGDLVTSVEFWTNYSEDGSPVEMYLEERTSLTYSNRNVVRQELEAVAGPDSGDETVTYTFDDKPNPFYLNLGWLLWEGNFVSFFSKNNVATGSIAGPEGYDWTLSYTYNEHGYPTQAVYQDDEQTYTYDATYSCK